MKAFLIYIVALFVNTSFLSAQTKGFKRYKAFNGITFEYTVLLPKGYDNNKSYNTAVAFAAVDAKNDQTIWSVNNLWKNHKNYDYIIIIPKVPVNEPDWLSHPIHHGFNDFLKFVKKSYKVKHQKIHFIGYKDGCIPAQTYITALEYPPASLTLLSSNYWEHYNNKEYTLLTQLKIPIRLFYTKKDKNASQVKQNIVKKLKSLNIDVQYKIIDTYTEELDNLLLKKAEN
ncbi:hypothetical protein ATO12_04815 [Aquimarina atlantica]|uniref:Uncharacterized protein n=1 Tax=Aquimarina atlantica TaxID=1317122 RepID=A0A023BPR7_9FLAO|nr:hypothetical protein [Aquimarina atlantica]EZH71944.1 hypothetical protein ATO12_04815 [Aquimarina atlantica]